MSSVFSYSGEKIRSFSMGESFGAVSKSPQGSNPQ